LATLNSGDRIQVFKKKSLFEARQDVIPILREDALNMA
jgi:hypothetical protein